MSKREIIGKDKLDHAISNHVWIWLFYINLLNPSQCGYSPGRYSLSGNTSYYEISRRLQARHWGVITIVYVWSLTGVSATLLENDAIKINLISRLQDLVRFDGKTSYGLVNRGSGWDLDTEARMKYRITKMTSSSEISSSDDFCVTGRLWRESTGHWLFTPTKDQ